MLEWDRALGQTVCLPSPGTDIISNGGFVAAVPLSECIREAGTWTVYSVYDAITDSVEFALCTRLQLCSIMCGDRSRRDNSVSLVNRDYK